MQESLSQEPVGPGQLLELSAYFQSDLAHIAFIAVVQHAVREHQQHVLDELLGVAIHVVAELPADRPKVHRVLHDVEVVANIELLRVDWLVE